MKRAASWTLLFAGACCMARGGLSLYRYHAFENSPNPFVAKKSTARKATPREGTSEDNNSPVPRILGRLEVPRLHMSVTVVEGADEESLGIAAGHVPGTAAIGAKGNSVIAGHRDTAFRPLRRIAIGDRILLCGSTTYAYVVRSVRIVDPRDLSVLQSGDGTTLTLITCYPFRYLGDAPERYIVQAAAVSFRK